MSYKSQKALCASEIKYGYLYVNKGEIADHLPLAALPIILIDEKGNKYERKMHLSQKGRIDGLTDLYEKHQVRPGDTVDLSLDEMEPHLHLQFNKSTRTDNNVSIYSDNSLKSLIKSLREKIDKFEYIFYSNEANVRAMLVEPLLDTIGWHAPELSRELKGNTATKGNRAIRVDIALYKCFNLKVIIEVKSIEHNVISGTDAEKTREQLSSYKKNDRFKDVPYWFATNGRFWILYNSDVKEPLKVIDLCYQDQDKDKDNEIVDFFDKFSYERIDEDESKEFTKDESIKAPKGEFKVRMTNEEKDINETTIAATFHKFIENNFSIVQKMQENKRFPVTLIYKSEPQRANGKVSINNKVWYITHDHSTFFKKILVKQIIEEAKIPAKVEEF